MRVSLFIPCLADGILPRIGEAVAEVLHRLGLELEYPLGQTCCGQPAFNAGHWEDARRVARHFLKTFTHCEIIVSPSGSCVSMVRNHYPKLFAEFPSELELAKMVAGRTFEFSEFLVKKLGRADVDAEFPGRVTYHDSCHLNRELGVKEEPRALLRAVKGLELFELDEADRCCGFGGVFSLKFPEVSAAMARRKLERIRETRAAAVVAADPGCILQLRGYFHRHHFALPVLHLAEILAGQPQKR